MGRDYLKEFKNHCLTCEKYDIYSKGDSTERGYRCQKHGRPMAMDEECPSYRLDKLRSNSTIEDAVSWRCKRGYSPSRDSSYWYVTTAICDILGYPRECEYMIAFAHMQATVMRDTDENKVDLLKYEVYGPAIAWKLKKAYEDPKRKESVIKLCKKILEPEYLKLILNLIRVGNFECAILTYKQMIDMLAQRFNVYLENLEYTEEEIQILDTGKSRKRLRLD